MSIWKFSLIFLVYHWCTSFFSPFWSNAYLPIGLTPGLELSKTSGMWSIHKWMMFFNYAVFSFPLVGFQKFETLMVKTRHILMGAFVKKTRKIQTRESTLFEHQHEAHKGSHRCPDMRLRVNSFRCSWGSAGGPLVWFGRTVFSKFSTVSLSRELLVQCSQEVRRMLTSMGLENTNYLIALWWEN